jgi:dTDP-4-dehydrorhamnose reductase
MLSVILPNYNRGNQSAQPAENIVIDDGSTDYPTPARRPRNSVLDTGRVSGRFKVKLSPWETLLDRCAGEL